MLLPAACASARRTASAVAIIGVVAGAFSLTGCGSAQKPQASATHGTAAVSNPGIATTPNASQSPAPVENNPPGDISDSIAYVSYRNAVGHYTFVHPEGWTAVENGMSVTFTDKLNGISTSTHPAPAAPTVVTVQQEIAGLTSTQPAFQLRSVKPVSLPAGKGVLVVFRRNSAPDSVTGKVFRDEVNRYEIYRNGRLVTLDLYGAVGSDNVDPYTKISQSLRLS